MCDKNFDTSVEKRLLLSTYPLRIRAGWGLHKKKIKKCNMKEESIFVPFPAEDKRQAVWKKNKLETIASWNGNVTGGPPAPGGNCPC